MRTYAAILGVPFHAVETTAALAQAIDSTPANTLVLIDTPGLQRRPASRTWAATWRGFLSRRQDIDTHLILTASMRPRGPAQRRRPLPGVSAVEAAVHPPGRDNFFRCNVFARRRARRSRSRSSATGNPMPEDIEAATKDAHHRFIGTSIARGFAGSSLEHSWQQASNGLSSRQSTRRRTSQREALVLQHLPQVRLIARRIHDRLPDYISLDDLISTGVIGLLAAIDNFDPTLNVQLKTYAERRIRGAIMDSLREMDWAPRETRKKSKLIEARHPSRQAARRTRAGRGGDRRRVGHLPSPSIRSG